MYNELFIFVKPVDERRVKNNILTGLLIKFYEIVYVMIYYNVLEDLLCNVFV